MSFQNVLRKYREIAFSERDKGERFERLMQAFLLTSPMYQFEKVWMWDEFPEREQFGWVDVGIDLVARTLDGDYWAIQCKFYHESTKMEKKTVDSFLSTSSRSFVDADGKTIQFTQRLWISTSNLWGDNAEEALKNQHPPVSRLTLTNLEEAQVDWDKLDKGITGEQARTGKRDPKDHQRKAIELTHEHFLSADRGKLIMACGTGKTYTSLRIAEEETNQNGLVLFLVPSIALLGQTLREWTNFARESIFPVCICSDPKITKKTSKNEDNDLTSTLDLALPATTDIKSIVAQLRGLAAQKRKGLRVVFSTYQSIEVISEAQKQLLKENGGSYGVFDLIVCDEAHRTTGAALTEEDASIFTKVHRNEFIQGKKRLYMTATPRIFSDSAKSKAEMDDAVLCSMDDETLYGPEIYRIGFGEAVEKGLLADYKVLVLTMSDMDVPLSVQKAIAGEGGEISTDDLSKLIGCVNALSKKILGDDGSMKETDPGPMRRAVAFCQSIAVSRSHTKTFNDMGRVKEEWPEPSEVYGLVEVQSEHIDGSMNAPTRDALLSWLKAGDPNGEDCRILTNVRCLSEGVDVPSLDAVLFLSARNSQVDVVQSVGRVMRTSPGKKYGYIIIPVVIPADVDAEKALDSNDQYKVVWTVLNALRAHDDRFNAEVNKIELNKQRPQNILVGRPDYGSEGEYSGVSSGMTRDALGRQLSIQFEQLQGVVYAKLVQKVGEKRYWEQWARDVAGIAQRQMERITRLVKEDEAHRAAFDAFLEGLRENINPSIGEDEAVEMLAQHMITRPVFDALFQDYGFAKHNPISVSMQQMLDLLEEGAVAKDTEVLERFYDSVRKRAEGIDNAEGKQRIIIELYDKFFKTAFPLMVERLGIVYTPVEVVDFIIRSVEDVLRQEFGRGLTDENVHILDPFTGTGTFITRLLQSGVIQPEDLERKYGKEIHANEIVLLAYYIAAVNIENAYHDLAAKDGGYRSFEGICLTDTFQLGEADEEKLFNDVFRQNSERVERQRKAPLRVIVGNPPYSVGQKSANDNAQNQSYPKLDSRIAETYAKESNAGLNKSLYDSYIKAFRWSSDRLEKEYGGVIAFVSNGAWIDGNSTDGFRKALEREFHKIYVLNLRGNQRTSGEMSRREGGKIFGSGSRTPISVTLLVKQPGKHTGQAQIFYHDIGDYLSREEKLERVAHFQSIRSPKLNWLNVIPNEQGDWLNKRNEKFGDFIQIEPNKKFDQTSNAYFNTYAIGLASNRDSWVYNSSSRVVEENMRRTIHFYNDQKAKFHEALSKNPTLKVEAIIDTDPKQISWTRALRRDVEKGAEHKFMGSEITKSIYRPFFKLFLYFDKPFIESPGLSLKLFPNKIAENKLITITGSGASKNFSALITNCITNLDTLEKSQCFPLYYYEEQSTTQLSMFDKGEGKMIRRDGITDFIHNQAKKRYGSRVTKEDIFYYVYGFLYSPQYREEFAADLKKMLPRLPLVEAPKDFWAFSAAGRELADLHLNYENVPPHAGVTVTGAESGHFKVEKMRFPKKGQKDTIHYNSKITLSNIPAEAYDYVVNGKSAIEWIMERYQITTHKESGITNDPNDWAAEVGNPRYILDLLLSIIEVSVRTVRIVDGLPKVGF